MDVPDSEKGRKSGQPRREDTTQQGATIRDVARLAAVSQGTVSRVLNGLSVGEKLKERVTKAITELNYQPSAIARSMRTRSTHTVGLMITDISNPVLAAIARGAEEILHPLGYTLIVYNTARHPERETQTLKMLLQRRVDGLLVTVEDEKRPSLHEALSRLRTPVVLIDRDVPMPFDRVLVDHARGLRAATEYLISLGHRRIALITASRSCQPGRDRILGYETAVRKAGLPLDQELVRSQSLASEYGFRETSYLLRSKNPPTAIIAGGNQIFEGMLEAVRNMGWRIPDHLSVIACDDTALTRLGSPTITVVQRDLSALGKLTAGMLAERMAGKAGEEQRTMVLPTSLVLRESCAPPTFLDLTSDP